MRPCKSVSLSLGPLKYNTSKAIRTVPQALLRPSPYQQDSIYWQMQEPTSMYRLPHFPPSTLCTLHTSGISPQWSSHHIKPTPICLNGLLHTYYVSLLERKSPLVKIHISLYQLASIRQRIQMALHRMLVSFIQAPKWALANAVCASSAHTSPVSCLSKVFS
jgi:hypothetical protein